MDIQKLIIRPMEKEEKKTVAKLGRKTFDFFEALFIGAPHKAMVAEYEGKIIGAIAYKFISNSKKQVVYIDSAFVDPAYHGLSVGKKLYTETFNYLQEWGCDGMTALIKDDNVASWKPAMHNGFQRVTLAEATRQLGLSQMLRHYFLTPMCIAVGMDFYLLCPKAEVAPKKEQPSQLLTFLLGNMLLTIPLWTRLLSKGITYALPFIAAYFTILAIFAITRFLGARFSGMNYHFRFNNCGGFLSMALGYLGNVFPMNANWYPEKYENTDTFRQKLAMPELAKWGIFVLLPLLGFVENAYLNALAQISSFFLVFQIIPIYPFDGYGAGRIFKYKKGLWLITAVISIALLIFI